MDKHQEFAASAASTAHANQASAPHLPQPRDPPPSYTEAMNHPIVESANQPSTTPSAPTLVANATNPYPYNPYIAQGQPAQQYASNPYAQNDGQFSAWDERATQIFMQRRLEMEERFRQARNQQEQDMLWNLILTDLYISGYHDFILVDLIRFWGFQFHLYQSIINDLSSGSHTDTNWQYFEPMDNVFKSSTNVADSTTTIGSSVLDHDHDIIPHVPVQPVMMPSSTTTVEPITNGSATAADVANINNSTLTSTTTIGGGDNSTVTPVAAIAGGDNTTLTNLPVSEEAVTSLPVDNAASGLTNIGSIQASLPSEPTGSNILNDVTSATVITAQPDSISKILPGDGDVITTQPVSTGLLSTEQPLESIHDNNDGCCGDDDGCCGDDGCCDDDGCCGNDDGCCDGGCDGCDGCDDC